jgi:hypothetical protein
MATVQTFNNNQDENDPSKPKSLSGGSAAPTVTGAPANPNASAPSAKGSSSGSFTNLNAYLNANKNYKQDQGGLAGQIYGNLENKANTIGSKFDNANNDFKAQANQNHIQYNGDLVNKAVNNSSQFVNNQQDVDSFTKLRDAAYGGPTSIQGADQLKGQAQNFQSTANLSQSEGGRYSLLNKLYGNPTYNKGQQGLDNLLLQGNSQQLQKLNQVNPLANNLNTNLNTGIQQAQSLVGQYKNDADVARTQTRDALGNAVTGFDTTAQSAVQAANAGRDTAYQQALDNFRSGKISTTDLGKFGITNNTNLYGVNNNDPSSYFSKSNYTATKQNVLTPQQEAQIQALQKLSGNSLSGAPTSILAGYNDPSQAGQFAAQNAYNFNTNKFNTDIGAQKSAYDTQSAAISKQITEQQRLADLQAKNSGRNTTVTHNGQAPISGQADINQAIAKLQAQQSALNNQYGIGKGLNGSATIQQPNLTTRTLK